MSRILTFEFLSMFKNIGDFDMYENIGTRLPKNVVRDIEYVAEQEKSDKSSVVRQLLDMAVKQKLVEMALEKYSKREVSLGRAAELAKISLPDFMKVAADRKIPLNYSVNDLKNDFEDALKFKKR